MLLHNLLKRNMDDIRKVTYMANRRIHSVSRCNLKAEVRIHSTENLDMDDFKGFDRTSSNDSTLNDTFTMIRSNEFDAKVTHAQTTSIDDNEAESGFCSSESNSSFFREDNNALNVCSKFQDISNDGVDTSHNNYSTSEFIPENTFTSDSNGRTSPLLQTETLQSTDSDDTDSNSKEKKFSKKSILSEKYCWGVLVTILLNAVLISACIYVSCGISTLSKSELQRNKLFPSSLCVLDKHKTIKCSNHSMYLRYLLHVVNIKRNKTKTTEVAQATLSFSKHGEEAFPKEAMIENMRSSQHLVTNDSVVMFQDHKVIIGHSALYLLSTQLLFKSELRWNNTTNVYTVHIKKNNTTMMVKQISIFKGSLSLQSVNLMGQLKLQSGDTISIEVFPSEFVYSCKGCNILTMMRLK